MQRLVFLAAAGIAIAGMSPADAASRHKHKVRAAPAVTQRAPAMTQPAFANRPIWGAPQQCFTDDGYGRFLPCDVSDGR